MLKQNVFIFDIDGTLSDPVNRFHFWKKKEYDNFNAKCGEDKPIKAITEICNGLLKAGKKIIFLTGRTENYKNETQEWLKKHMKQYHPQTSILMMRPKEDKTESTEFKRKAYREVIKDQFNVIAVFEDREKICKMWREEGVYCIEINSIMNIADDLERIQELQIKQIINN